MLSIAWMCRRRRRLWFVRLYFGTPVTQSGSCRWGSASRTNVNRYHLCVYVCSLWDMYSPAKRETGAVGGGWITKGLGLLNPGLYCKFQAIKSTWRGVLHPDAILYQKRHRAYTQHAYRQCILNRWKRV
jgi:hypothetical protein